MMAALYYGQYGLLDPALQGYGQPQTKKPSILERVVGRLFPTAQYMGLLDAGQQSGLQGQGLLSLGLNLLNASGPRVVGTPGSSFGERIGGALQGAVTGFPQMAEQALQLQALQLQRATQRAVAETVAKHPAKPGEGTEGTYKRIAAMVGELAGQPGTEDLIGKLSNVLAQLKPTERRERWQLKAGINPTTGQPELFRIDPETGEVAPIGLGAILPSGVTQPSEGERRAGAMQTVAETAYRHLEDATTPSAEDVAAARVPFGLGQTFITPRQQLQNQAAFQLSQAYLTTVSGAAVPETEVERFAKTFTPQLGDSPETITRKRGERKTIIEAMRLAAGRALKPSAPAPATSQYRPGNPFAPK